MPKLQVLQAVGQLNYGGIEVWLRRLLECCDPAQLGFDFLCLADYDSPLKKSLEQLGARVFTTSPGRLKKTLGEMLETGHYDAVHSHIWMRSGLALGVARSAGIPVRIAHLHNTDDGKPRTVRRRAYLFMMRRMIRRNATCLVGCSQAAVSIIGAAESAGSANRLVMPCGFDLDYFSRRPHRNEARKIFGIPGDATVIGNVASLTAQKAPLAFVDIARGIASLIPDSWFLWTGDGPLRNRVEAAAHEHGLGRRFVLTGVAADTRAAYAAMDLLLFPSIYEGFGVVVAEAAVCGLPTVVADIAGAREAASLASGSRLYEAGNTRAGVEAVIASLGSSGNLTAEGREILDIHEQARRLGSIYAGESP